MANRKQPRSERLFAHGRSSSAAGHCHYGPPPSNEQDIKTLRERICFYERAVETYYESAWDLLILGAYRDPVELSAIVDPERARALGPLDRDRVVAQRHVLRRQLEMKVSFFKGTLVDAYRDYAKLLEQAPNDR